MLELLSKLKHDCHSNGVELLNAGINGSTIKLTCCVNGRRDTELNAYITPHGDDYKFVTKSMAGDTSDEIIISEPQIVPTLVASVNPNKPKDEVIETPECPECGIDKVTIEVEDNVFDKKFTKRGQYCNSRYAYSDKYHKMGTIHDIEQMDTNLNKVLDKYLPQFSTGNWYPTMKAIADDLNVKFEIGEIANDTFDRFLWWLDGNNDKVSKEMVDVAEYLAYLSNY
jgi:hypothetical protein